MALQSSGVIALSDIQTEFGGSNPISLSEYYRGGAYTTANNTSVPTSGAISLSNFYSAVRQFAFTISTNTQEANLATLATAAGWDGSAPLAVTVASGVWLWSDSTSLGGLIIPSSIVNGVTLTNNGYIIGRGGNGGGGNGQAGGPAIANSASGVSIINASGAYIAGGGGGGGGWSNGGGGGAGGGFGSGGGGAGGAINTAGSDGTFITYGGDYGSGGGAGGGGGFGGGGGGGRILPGVGGAGGLGGGNGGSAGAAGANGSFSGATSTHSGGGGGGWGAAGGNSSTGSLGGAGGAAVSGTSVSMTNNGTIYGAVA